MNKYIRQTGSRKTKSFAQTHQIGHKKDCACKKENLIAKFQAVHSRRSKK